MTSQSGKRAFKADDVYRLVQVSDPRLSPDGTAVAYVVTTVDQEEDEYRSHLWLVALDGGEPRQLTRGAHRDASPRWSPDGKRLAFVSNRKEKRNQVWLIGEQGEAWQLTDTPRGAVNPVWSPDGQTVLYQTKSCETGETKPHDKRTPHEKHAPRVLRDIIYRLDGEGQFDETKAHLWMVPAEGGEARQLTAGDWNDGQAIWSPDGRAVAFTSYRGEDRGERLLSDVWVVPADGGELRKLTQSRGPSTLPCWSPDGRALAYTGHVRGEATGATTLVWTVPAEGGTPQPLNERLDRTGFGMPMGQALAWLPDGRGLLYLAQDAGAVRLYRVPAEGGDSEPLTGLDRWLTAFDVSRDGTTVVFASTSQTQPGELYALSLRDGTVRQLTHHNDALLDEVELIEPEPFSFAGADGLEIPAWIIKPAKRTDGGRMPLVLSIHGGPHGMYGMTFWPGFHEWVGRGFAVLLVNPRGSAGYGERFMAGCIDDWGGGDYEDLMRAVDWTVAQDIADPEQLCVTGYSYGGYMTAWVAGRTDRFRAAVCGAPVSDLVSMYGESDVGAWFNAAEFAGPLWERWDVYRERSPLYHIHNCRTPFLLLHWEGDLRCPIGQSEELFTVLRKLRRPVELVRYPGGGHVAFTPSQLADRIQRTGDWFERWLEERPVPAN